MNRPAVILLLLALCLCRGFTASAQDRLSDSLAFAEDYRAIAPYIGGQTQKRNFLQRVFDYFDSSAVDKTFEKKMDFTFVAGPSYSSKTNLSIGILAAGLYRVDRRDRLSSPSNVSIFGNFAISGYYYVGISGNTFFKQNRHRIDYELGFRSQPTSFWGLGYNAAMTNSVANYTAKKYLVDVQYKYALIDNLYAGAALNFNYTWAKNLLSSQYLDGQGLKYTAAGIGPFIEYDSRDIVTQPFGGWYASVNAIIYPKPFGNCGSTLWRVKVTVDYYQKLWKDAILACDLYGEFNSDNTPWTMYAMMGGNFRMRGYYEGRFNNLDMITLQVELRQRIYRRIGCVVWGGAGNVFRSFREFDWNETLPNYGAGLRWELKKRMNIRFDYGFGKRIQNKLTSSFIMSINEAF